MISAGVARQAFEIFMGIINWIVSIIIWPISMLIKQYFPPIDSALTSMATWIGHLTDYAGWVLNAFGIPAIVITLVVAYYTYTLGTSFAAFAIKQAIRWYKALRL